MHFGNVAAAFLMPVFNSGRVAAIADGQDAVASQMLLRWQHSVLVAVQEVEISLTVKSSEEARGLSLAQEQMRRRSAMQHARSLFREGQIGQLPLLQAQRAELASEIDAVDSAEKRMLSYVQLYKALGGGWLSPGPGATQASAAAPTNSADRRNSK